MMPDGVITHIRYEKKVPRRQRWIRRYHYDPKWLCIDDEVNETSHIITVAGSWRFRWPNNQIMILDPSDTCRYTELLRKMTTPNGPSLLSYSLCIQYLLLILMISVVTEIKMIVTPLLITRDLLHASLTNAVREKRIGDEKSPYLAKSKDKSWMRLPLSTMSSYQANSSS